MSRSATRPAISPRSRAPASSLRATLRSTSRIPTTLRVRTNQAWIGRLVDRLHRRRDRPAGALDEVEAGQLERAEVEADEDHRALLGERRVDHRRVLDRRPLGDVRSRPSSGRASSRGSSGRSGGRPIGRAARAAPGCRPPARPSGRPPSRGHPGHDPREVGPGQLALGRCEPIPDVTAQLRQPDRQPFGQVAGAPRGRGQEPGGQAAARAAAAFPAAHRVAGRHLRLAAMRSARAASMPGLGRRSPATSA